jgi:hypothetical protein
VLSRIVGQPCDVRGKLAVREASTAHELEQRLVDLVGMGPRDVVRAAFDGHELQVLDQTGQALWRLVG